MPVHPQMRQQYPPGPYGQQPLPPMPPQQGGGAPQTAPQGPDDGGSVNTGESDNATPSQQPQQQQPYMQQPGPYGAPPPGAYPYAPQYGQMQGRYPMHPGQQMHQPVLPPGGPRPMYPQQYMGGAPQMMSQYPPQHMGGGPMHRNQPYYNGPPQGYNPQQHGGNNPDQDNKNRNNNNNNQKNNSNGGGDVEKIRSIPLYSSNEQKNSSGAIEKMEELSAMPSYIPIRVNCIQCEFGKTKKLSIPL